MELNYYLNNIDYGEAALILGSEYNKDVKIKGDSIKQFLLQVATDRRISKIVKMLGIEQSVLEQKPDDVSNLDLALIKIAYQLLQGKELVLNHLDVLLNYKEEIYLKRLLIKLVHQYGIKLAIFTNNISFCFKLIDYIIIVQNQEIKKILSNNFYDLEIYKYIDMPDIINFVMRAKSRGKKLENYLEISELIKGIYRL